jgi:hypothetical protein
MARTRDESRKASTTAAPTTQGGCKAVPLRCRQVTSKDSASALRTIERAHARSLLEEFSVGGTDLDLGRTAEEGDTLKKKESALKAKISEIEKRIAEGAKDPGLPGELAAAKEKLFEHDREARASSPVYQNLISSGGGPPRLSTLQREQVEGALLLGLARADWAAVRIEIVRAGRP